MTPAQALEHLLPYANHRVDCDTQLPRYDWINPPCNCNVARAIQDALEALSDAEPLVAPGRAEPDVVRP